MRTTTTSRPNAGAPRGIGLSDAAEETTKRGHNRYGRSERQNGVGYNAEEEEGWGNDTTKEEEEGK